MKQTRFLNVDLDVHSQAPLSDLTLALSEVASNLNEGLEDCEGFARYEVLKDAQIPEDVISCFVGALEQLPEKCRSLWENAKLREFSVGIQGGSDPHSSEWRLTPALLARIAALNAELSIVVYAGDLSEVGNNA